MSQTCEFIFNISSLSAITVILLSTQSFAEPEAQTDSHQHSASYAAGTFNSPQAALHFPHELAENHRTKRNVFYDMIDDFAGDDDDDDGSEEEEGEEEDEAISESVETTTTRFGRFISPLAFSKISETLGKKFICFCGIASEIM